MSHIVAIQEKVHYIYGSERIRFALLRLVDFPINHKRVERLMDVHGLQSKLRRKKKRVYRKHKPEEVKENILSRDFQAMRPNEKWVTDITEIKLDHWKKKRYICTILDLYDNYPIACVVGARNNVALVHKALNIALKEERAEPTLLHSDRGFQFTRKQFCAYLGKNNIIQSMSRVSKCIDNGPVESFQGLMKDEIQLMFDNKTPEQFEDYLAEYLFFYKHERLQKRLKGLTPQEARDRAKQSTTPPVYPIPINYQVKKYWDTLSKQ